jgi:hypothetical protein
MDFIQTIMKDFRPSFHREYQLAMELNGSPCHCKESWFDFEILFH